MIEITVKVSQDIADELCKKKHADKGELALLVQRLLKKAMACAVYHEAWALHADLYPEQPESFPRMFMAFARERCPYLTEAEITELLGLCAEGQAKGGEQT